MPDETADGAADETASDVAAPVGLLAELTYRCPLACPYCSNPLDLAAYDEELDGEQWCEVLEQAQRLGVLQVHLSGGEPLLRRDLEVVAARGRSLGLYLNLVTSGVGLTHARMEALGSAGVDHVQLSVQAPTARRSDEIAGSPSFVRKVAAADAVTAAGLPLTVNVVLHRATMDAVPGLVDLAVRLGAQRLELANVQLYGWAHLNRAALLPTADQLRQTDEAVATARARVGAALEIVYVLADYFTGRPKPCMQGWGSRQLVVAPDGRVLPCSVAGTIPGVRPWNVRTRSLAAAWFDSPAFNLFRGTAWMPEPCAGCALRTHDFGGCRCQAYLLTGDAAATDPACVKSPEHHLVVAARDAATRSPGRLVPRPHIGRR